MSGPMNGPKPGLRDPLAGKRLPPKPNASRDGFENEKSEVSFSERRTGPSPEGAAMAKRHAAAAAQSTAPPTLKAPAAESFGPSSAPMAQPPPGAETGP